MDDALFGELRSLLQQPMSKKIWTSITLLLDDFDDDDLERVIAPYLLAHFERLPEVIARFAPHSWYEASRSAARKRVYASLMAIPCPKCDELCNQSEVTGALKARHGRHYTQLVRTRDVMTGDRVARHVVWECTRCRQQAVTCPNCTRDMTYREVLEAMRMLHADAMHARETAQRVLDDYDVSSIDWACIDCLNARTSSCHKAP